MGAAMHRLSLSALIAAAAALAACQQEPAAENNAAQGPVLNLPSVPKPQPPIDRAALLTAVAEAASATAAGTELPTSIRALDGRQFEIRIRFGCRGPSTDLAERWLGWSFDPEERRIRVRAVPTISSNEPIVERIVDERIEAVEGFWLTRPWLRAPVCPATAAVRPATEDPPPAGDGNQQARPSLSGQERQKRPPVTTAGDPASERAADSLPAAPRIGIAQFFTAEDPRSSRRGTRPYQAEHRLADGEALSSQGYNLVLSGRLRALPGSGVIHCVSRGPDVPPECIVSAEFLRVWIEQPETRKVIAEWGSG
jgi:hypothetical protein